jgi:hypothetical protein
MEEAMARAGPPVGKPLPILELKALILTDGASSCSAQVKIKYYEGETHTSPLIENPMRGGHDHLVDDILACVLGDKTLSPWQMPLCPAILIDAAAWVCPF